jgi:hypothetical protein
MRTSKVPVTAIIDQCRDLGVTLAPGEYDALRVSPPGVLPSILKADLKAHKVDILKLLSAPPADIMSHEPCPICRSHERWQWLDGRLLCRVCLVLDLAPLTLLRGGWDRPPGRRAEGGS